MIKKLFGFMLIAVFVFTTFSVGAVQINDEIAPKYEKAVTRLLELEIMQGYEDGSFKAEKEVTRAEFTTIMMNILGMQGSVVTDSGFDDVSAEHWAASHIKLASDMGIINGIGNGLFAPDNGVTFEQALKITVEVLGYGVLANDEGGYPEGYIAVASDRGLLKGIATPMGEKMTRGEVALLIDLALDVPVLEKTIGKDNHFEILSGEKSTLYEQMMFKSDLINIQGVVTATSYTSIDGSDYLKDGFVKIGNKVYKTGDTDVSNSLGYYINAYVTDNDADNANTVISYSLMNGKNEILEIDAEDINADTTLNDVSYIINNRNKKKDISNAAFIYNGKYISRGNLTNNDIIMHNGGLTLINNDDNDDIDVVFITERESFIVDRIASGSETIYFKSGFSFNGREGFKITSDDEDKEFTIYDKQGNIIEFSDIKVNNVVTLEISRDGKFGSIYVSDEQLTGTVSAIKDDGSIGMEDGCEYKLYRSADGSFKYSVSVGNEAVFLLDCDGFIVGDDGNKTLLYNYAYVINSAVENGISDSLKIKAIIPGEREKIVEKVDNTENVSYVFKNKEVLVLETADKVRYTPENGSQVRVSGREIGSALIGKVIRYRTNAEGKITELQYFSPEKKKHNFNAKIMSFGNTGAYIVEPFVANEASNFIMIPESTSPTDEDFFVEVEVADGGEVTLMPVMVDDETQTAEAILVFANMDATTPKPFKDTTDISIVGKVTSVLGDNGEVAYRLSTLSKNKLKESIMPESNNKISVVSGLIKGDLIRFNENSTGEIANIEKIATLQGLENYYFRTNANGPNERVFGIVQSTELHRLNGQYNEYMDSITVNYGEGVKEYLIPCEDGPEFYMYDRVSGDISVATSDDIVAADVAGDGATKIFMVVNNNEVMAVVLIVD